MDIQQRVASRPPVPYTAVPTPLYSTDMVVIRRELDRMPITNSTATIEKTWRLDRTWYDLSRSEIAYSLSRWVHPDGQIAVSLSPSDTPGLLNASIWTKKGKV